ncbi:tetratricopeptide repeat domain-containing protein [Aspergillus brunneoviolaceus CBS 621.78]|uniref:Tetratricopeptide repeat domain-containing protein n=1 Tax=Aspergillus brunneoviolaceus CBS 621.78 TaxID=1450534 RepID=A0ACD1GGU3_9EURO|nr:tetratricopeptide repeat domain-containing protein [Aspergillus brunneoviolaceus CBS 621.78]RAH48301.1 tetratricopeptide repeat domain-containing protein [Aspergillus brunneoviolaceus CBS 621.78]
MDPFSILVGSAGLTDVSFRIISYLATIRSASAKIQDELTILSQEISSLIAVNETVEDCWHSWHDPSSFDILANDEAHVTDVWKNLAMLLQQSKGHVEQLETLLNAVIGSNGLQVAGKLDGLRKTIRKQGRDGEFMQLRQRIANHQAGIQILLNALTLCSHTAKDRAVGNLSENLRRQNTKMQIRLNSLRRELRGGPNSDSLCSSLGCADVVASLIRFNEHFDMPQNVSSYYTGRHKQLEQLKATLSGGLTPEHQGHQKRFVIYGLGGSGKTQFCCKFAQDNRKHFWGVFWVDGSSYVNIQHSYARIARIGGVEANENAAKAWLSSLRQPWLLLIDNADDPEMDVVRCLPAGERGVILITTRNPTSKQYGTEGPRLFHFDQLETQEASDLLLAAAVCPRPWGVSTGQYADRIAQILGYLPLALIHAGKAILDQLCSLTDYPEYYERTWNRVRRSRSTRTRSRAREANDHGDASSNLRVYSSYEMIYVRLESRSDQRSRDALDLLRMFSFFYWENIEYDLIRAAATNPRQEREETQARREQTIQQQQSLSSLLPGPRARTWAWIAGPYQWIATMADRRTRPSATLPDLLRDEDDQPFDEDRLRGALSLLVRLGMVTLHEENNSYWMHPMVHTWVRQRPETSTAEQALWCQAAATALAQSICFHAPRGSTAQGERHKRQIHPHVEHVRRCQAEVEARLAENQRRGRRPWHQTAYLYLLPPQRGLRRPHQAVEAAKFSLVYLQCGQYAQAEELQRQVKEYIFARSGPESEHGITIARLLSKTYALQTRNNEARALQYRVLDAAVRFYGPDHPLTLQIMDDLGATCLAGSRLQEAYCLHQAVVRKLSQLDGFGPQHETTCAAVQSLAHVEHRHLEHEKAFELQSRAYEGLRRILGPTHPQTLEAQDNLASSYGFLGEAHLPLALQMSEEVLQIRTQTLGREHPLTLQSTLTVAKIQTAMDRFAEAEQLFLDGLPVAERNLGPNHLGTLAARTWLGHLYWRQERHAEAQAIWIDVISKQRYEQSRRADGEHTDRIQAMWFLLHSYEDQGRVDDALRISEEITQLLYDFGGEGLGPKHKL